MKRRVIVRCNIDTKLGVGIEYMKATPFPLKPHQIDGLRWLLKTECRTGHKGGLLCDDPGLGKTIQLAALMKAHPVRLTLIIVPVAVVNQWYLVMEKMFDASAIYLHTGNNRVTTQQELHIKLATTSVVITTMGTIVRNKTSFNNNVDATLNKLKWGRVIVDEVHYIRNSKTKLFKACGALCATHKWGLTGTPIQNSEKDLTSLLKFVGISNDTITQVTKSSDGDKPNLQKYILRRTKKIIIDDHSIPSDYRIINHVCGFHTDIEQRIYSKINENVIEALSGSEPPSSFELLELIIRLRQAVIDPRITIKALRKKFAGIGSNWPQMTGQSTKMLALMKVIKEVKGMSLVFCHFRDEMQLIKQNLHSAGIKSHIYDGRLNTTQRHNLLELYTPKTETIKFNGKILQLKSTGPLVLIIQIKAGGVGLNLQQFKNIFIVSPDWNPANEIQAIGRAHRIGQRDDVVVHKFTIVSNAKYEETDSTGKKIKLYTIDERIMNRQRYKREIMTTILDDSTLVFNETSITE